MRVLVACEYSGRVREAFRLRGHDAWSIDLLPSECDPDRRHYIGDAIALAYGAPWDLMIAHPPCTYLTNSGVRWMNADRYVSMLEAAHFYAELWRAPIPKVCIENPVMHGYGREAIERLIGPIGRQFVQPWWFGEKMFKRTGYALRGLPELIPTNKLVPPKAGTQEHKEWSWVHRASPGPDRWKIRSRTPVGIANAMAEQWG